MGYKGKSEAVISFSDFSDGLNNTENELNIGRNQVYETENCILRKNGAESRPGFDALPLQSFPGRIYGSHEYTLKNGTRRILVKYGNSIYIMNKTTGEIGSAVISLGGSGNASFVDYLNKCWICDGNSFVKIEDNVGYKVTIDPPTGVTAEAAVGGSLSSGTYTLHVTYARKVSGSNVLYSKNFSLGTVTISGANNRIYINWSQNSSDSQVNNKVIWITKKNGSIVYFLTETGDNSTQTIYIDSLENLNENILLSTYATKNENIGGDVVPVFKYLFAFNGRLWGVAANDNTVWFSLKNTANVYDMERWFPENYTVLPFEVNGFFSIGADLFYNTPKGIIKQPNGDPATEWHLIPGLYFWNMKTVKNYRSYVIGLTQDGVKVFDGEKFLDYDISMSIKSEINKIYQYQTWEPVAEINRRNIRTEYHLSYCDEALSVHSNNVRLVLNLDKLEFYPERRVSAPWEYWSVGFTHSFVDYKNKIFYVQSHNDNSKIYTEDFNNSIDDGIYSKAGALLSSENVYKMVRTGTRLLDLSSRARYSPAMTLVKTAVSTTIEVHVSDGVDEVLSSEVIDTVSSNLWDVMLWDVGLWAGERPSVNKVKIPFNYKGKMVYVKFYQTGNDIDWNVLLIEINAEITKGRLT